MRGNWLVLSMVVVGCSATGDMSSSSSSATSSSSAGALCVPGQQIECACPGGGKGAQKCRGDGTGFESCEGCENAGSTSGGLGGATSSSSDGGHGGGSSSSMGGGGGGSSSSTSTSSTGGHECSIATDCGATSYCLYRQCLDDKCSAKIAADGTELPKAQQTEGDCAVLMCDGQGGTKSVYVDYDPASDGQECTADTCTPQGTTHPAKPTGTPCSTGLCNDSQGCVAHIPVKCQLKNGGTVYTGCDGIYHAGLTMVYTKPDQMDAFCNGTPADVGYCPPGSLCTVVIDHGAPQSGTCQ